MRKHTSLNKRLLALALSTVVIVWMGATAFTYYDARHEFNEVLDAHLAQVATLLVAQVSHDLDEIETEQSIVFNHEYSHYSTHPNTDYTLSRAIQPYFRPAHQPGTRIAPSSNVPASASI